MTQDEIIRMAREADIYCWHKTWDADDMRRIERFAALVAAHEREACAKVCEQDMLGDNSRRDYERMNCAAAIRARNEK